MARPPRIEYPGALLSARTLPSGASSEGPPCHRWALHSYPVFLARHDHPWLRPVVALV